MKRLYNILPVITLSLIAILSISCEKVVYTFDNTKPRIISGPAVLSVTDGTSTIYWETDEACHAEVRYGTSTKYDSVYKFDENREYHTVTLLSLCPYTQYHYKVYNWDFADNGPAKSEDSTFTTLHNEYSLLREGWSQYSAGNFSAALSLIYESFNRNPFVPATYAAMGWAQLRLDSLDAARESFATAYSLNPYLNITLAGLAVISMIDNQPQNAINYANKVLSNDPEWVYEYAESINYLRIHLILAEAYYQTQQIEKAQSELDFVWPENGLDPNVPTTWIIGEQEYGSYAEALIAAINYAADNIELGKKVNLELV